MVSLNIRILKLIVWITCILISFAIVRQIYLDISQYPFFSEDMTLYEPYQISDWLINYQGGFVRRGLAGEVLWRLYQLHPFPVIIVIICICAVSLVCLATLCVCLFRRMGWPVWLLLFPIFLYFHVYGVYSGTGLLACRRDSLILLLGFLLFCRYKRYQRLRTGIVVVWMLSTLILLLYEGIFFSLFPFLALHTLMNDRCSFGKRVEKMFFLWWPVAVLMLVISLWHGDEHIPEQIWQSWMPCFESFPVSDNIPAIGMGPKYLTVSFSEQFDKVFGYTWLSDFGLGLPVWPFNIYTLLATYYLFTRIDALGFGKSIGADRRIQMSNLMLLQLLFIMPMLGFVANDYFRSIPYTCITSCFLCYLFPERGNMPIYLDRFSSWLQTKIDNSFLLRNPWTYYVVLVTLPLCGNNAQPGGMFPFIPNDLKHQLVEMMLG